MTNTSQITKTEHGISKLAIGLLLVVFGLGFFAIGIDQGQLFSLVYGESAYHQVGGMAMTHEFSHDMRHASGFPCH